MKEKTEDTFGSRLLKAFRDAKLTSEHSEKSDIAQIMGVQNSSITGWMGADTGKGSYPKIETLLLISEKTKCNLHWLLTGEGVERQDRLDFLSQNERHIVERLALEDDRTEGEVVNSLVIEALAKRASEIFIHLNQTGRITEQERQQLVLLYGLVLDRSSSD